jgi:hypothetical protein
MNRKKNKNQTTKEKVSEIHKKIHGICSKTLQGIDFQVLSLGNPYLT